MLCGVFSNMSTTPTRKRSHSTGEADIDVSADPTPGTSNSVSPTHDTQVPKKAKKHASKANKPLSQPCSDEAMDSAINSVIANTQANNNDANVSAKANDNAAKVIHLQQQVTNLTSVVNRQQETITRLERQMNDFLSAFGLSMSPPSSPSSSSQTVTAPPGVPGVSVVSDGSSTHQQQQSSSGQAANKAVPQSSSSGTVKPKTIRDTVVAAVYVDKAVSDRRSASFIVSGLPPKPSCHDQLLVADLCHRELTRKPEVTYAKRLGRPTPGRIQPLLVHVKTTDEARYITSNARRLRQSTDPDIRQNVFINVNLTRAESKAAYELRCRRRAADGRAGGAEAVVAAGLPVSSSSPLSSGTTAATGQHHPVNVLPPLTGTINLPPANASQPLNCAAPAFTPGAK